MVHVKGASDSAMIRTKSNSNSFNFNLPYLDCYLGALKIKYWLIRMLHPHLFVKATILATLSALIRLSDFTLRSRLSYGPTGSEKYLIERLPSFSSPCNIIQYNIQSTS